jgi:cell division protein FtsB
LFSSRWLLVALVIAGLGLQADLWFSDDGYQKTQKLRFAVAEQRALNDALRERNAALDAEVDRPWHDR